MGQFSKATLLEVLSLYYNKTHSELDSFFYKYEMLNVVENASNKDNKLLYAAIYIDENPNAEGILGGKLDFEIVEEIVTSVLDNVYKYNRDTGEFIDHPKLKKLLLIDGFEIRDNSLIRRVDSTIDYVENESLLNKLLNKYNFDIAEGHYKQAVSAFTRGDWAACNAQLRSYVEELFSKLAKDITGNTFTDSHAARTALSQGNNKLFYPELNEWLNNGNGFFETFWKRLHPQGSHPGLSDESDSMFRLNLVQISTLEIMKRYDNSQNPF